MTERSPETLSRSAGGLDAAFHGMAQAVLLVALPDRRIVDANDAMVQLIGGTREGLVGRPARSLHLDEERFVHFGEEIRRAWERRTAVVVETSLRRGDGTTFPARITLSTAGSGEARAMLGVVQDMTEPRRLEEKARQDERRLQTLVRVQEELARSLDVAQVVQTATDACTVLSGAEFGAFFYNVVDARGESYTLYTVSGVPREAFSKFPMPRNTAIFAPTFAGERIVRSDDITKDPRYGRSAPHHGMPAGHLPVKSYLAAPVVSRDGVVHGGIFLGHKDVGVFTKESEDLVAAIVAQTAGAMDNAALYRRARESEERFRNVVAHAPDQIVTIDGASHVVSANRGVASEPETALVGRDVVEALRFEDAEAARAVIARVLSKGTVGELETRVEHAGEERWFHVRVAPLVQNDAPGAVLISTDVTHRKRSQAELSRLTTQLLQGEKLAALGSLVSGVAHELRTPLTFLSNNAFLLQMRLTNASEAGASAKEAFAQCEPFLREITHGVDRLNQLVEDLRRYTKARLSAELAQKPLGDLVVDAIELFRATSRASQSVETSLSPTRPVRANPGALQQLAINLLQNASEASPPGSRILVTTRDERDEAILEVTDHGPGIPADVKARMFEPLFTTKKEGTGLGLSIAQRIVREHNGTIECDSSPKGTTFRIRLPHSQSG